MKDDNAIASPPRVTRAIAAKLLAKRDRAIKIAEAIMRGYRSHPSKYLDVQLVHSATTKSSIRRDHIVDEIQALFDDDDGVRFETKRRRLMMVVEETLRISFKKLRSSLLPGYIPTQQALRFMNQQPPLPGMPEITNVIAGYRPNETNTDVGVVLLVCPDGRKVEWYMDLTVSADIMPMPRETVRQRPAAKVQPKLSAKRKRVARKRE